VLSHLVTPRVECVESEGSHGRFVAEPLDRGFGITLGNALRRVLLGSLRGAAVTWIRIEGIQHEFSTIAHMKVPAVDWSGREVGAGGGGGERGPCRRHQSVD
jgi:hypothetical protein